MKTLESLPRETVIYISGPMTGLPEFNFPAFFAAEARLRRLGFTNILNPALMSQQMGMGYPKSVYMRADYEAVLKAGALYILDEWYHSSGAGGEIVVARDIDVTCISAITEAEMPKENFEDAGSVKVIPRPPSIAEQCIPCQPTGWKPA